MCPSTDTISAYGVTTTGWSEFTPSSGTIRSARVMANFNIFRGHLMPFDPTATVFRASTYDLGSATYPWRNVYGNVIGKRTPTVVSTTGSMSLTASHDVVLMNSAAGTITANLPDYTGATGTLLTIKNIGTASKGVMLTPYTGQLLEATTAAQELIDMESATLVANGGWYRI